MILYLDTSALFKLYVDEAGSDAVHAAVDAAESVAVSRIAWAEAMSALARRGRGFLSTWMRSTRPGRRCAMIGRVFGCWM